MPDDTVLSQVLFYSLPAIWHTFLLAMARIVPTIALVPFLGGKLAPNSVKIGLGVCITMLFLPFLLAKSSEPIEENYLFILLMFKEVMLGSLFGLIMSVPFYYCEGAGSLIDHQRGAQSLQVSNPSTQSQTSPLGNLYHNMMLVIFFSIGGPVLFFDALLTSFDVIPVNSLLSPAFFSQNTHMFETLMGIFALIVKMVFVLSAPSILSMLLSDLFLGIANRMAPQVQISFLLWSLKAFIGIGMVFLAWGILFDKFQILAKDWIHTFEKLMLTLTP